MHRLHGIKFTTSGHNQDLDNIPEVILDNAECVPIEIDGRYYWLVTGVDNCGAMTDNPDIEALSDECHPQYGQLGGVEAEVGTEVETTGRLFLLKD